MTTNFKEQFDNHLYKPLSLVRMLMNDRYEKRLQLELKTFIKK